MSANDTNGQDSIATRTERALEQYLTVLPDIGRARGAADLYLVVSQSGSEYLVDLRDGVCECPDHEHRGVRCKHLRRAAFATGEEPIPGDVLAAVDPDDQLGTHVAGGPQIAASDGGIVNAGDDAEIIEERDDARPDGCDCLPTFEDLPCFACYQAGFEKPNPNAREE
jgi:hypothetical protein